MRTAYEKGRVVYEPNQHEDDVTGDKIVRSQFGSPPASGNGARSRQDARKTPEPYRFDPAKPRRRRYSNPDGESGAAENAPGVGDPSPDATADSDSDSQWPVSRPSHLKRSANSGASEGNKRRLTRAERRRAAATEKSVKPPPTEEFTPPRSSDLTRIATFLRSTQELPSDSKGNAADQAESESHESETQAAGLRGRHAKPSESNQKTSELPTVAIEPMHTMPAASHSNEDANQDPAGNEVLSAVREVPGVTDARLSNSDNTLSLDIDDNADSDTVHRNVIAVLDSRLGMQAQPVSPAVGTVDADTQVERSAAGLAVGGRAVLERIQVITSGFESIVEVGLAVNGARAVGRSTGPAVDWHTLRGAADATVDAIGVLLGRSARVVVEHAAVEQAGQLRVAVVVVLLLTESGAEQLAGAAPVTGDRRQAVVHATLQALNRRLEVMLVA